MLPFILRSALLTVAMVGLVGVELASAQTPRLTAAELLEVANVSNLSVSPDNRFASFQVRRFNVSSNRVDQSLFVLPLEDSASATRVADIGDPMWDPAGEVATELTQWSADSRWLYLRRLTRGEVQIWRVRRNGTALQQVTHEAGDIREFRVDHELNRIFYVVGATRQEEDAAEQRLYDDGVLFDETVHTFQRILRNFPVNGTMRTVRLSVPRQESGGVAFDREVRLIMGEHLRVLDVDMRIARDATATEAERYRSTPPPVTVGLPPNARFATSTDDNGGTAFLVQTGPRLGASAAVYRLTWLDTSAARPSIDCSAPECEGRGLLGLRWSPATGEVLFLRRESIGSTGLFAWDIVANRVRPVFLQPGTISGIDSVRYGRDGDVCPLVGSATMCIVANPTEPPAIRRVDLRTGETTIVVDPNSAIRGRDYGRFEEFRWSDAEGRTNTGQLLLPTSSSLPLPLIILAYRCVGFLTGGPLDDYPVHLLTAHGFAVLCANANSETYDDRYDATLASYESAIRVLTERGVTDPGRVGIGGLSFGAEASLHAVSHSDLFAAAIASTPPIDPIYYYLEGARNSIGRAQLRRYWNRGSPDAEDDAVWREMSPALNADRISAPVLLQMSENEYLGALQLYAAIVDANGIVEMFIYPDEFHHKRQPAHKLRIYERNLDWYRFWLQGYVDSDPAKEEQYARWRKLHAERARHSAEPDASKSPKFNAGE